MNKLENALMQEHKEVIKELTNIYIINLNEDASCNEHGFD